MNKNITKFASDGRVMCSRGKRNGRGFAPWQWLRPLRAKHNPLLAAEWHRCWRGLRRSVWCYLFLVVALGHAGLVGYWLLARATPSEFDAYTIQFSVFHLWLYISPLVVMLLPWRRRMRAGEFEDRILTSASRGEIFWSIVLPRAALVLLSLYALYMPLLPLNDGWLVVLHSRGYGEIATPWTHLHLVITNAYFLTILLFNFTLAAWLALRVRATHRCWILLFALSLLLDFVTYTVFLLGVEDSFTLRQWPEAFLNWPMILYTLLLVHSLGPFAAIFYPIKWVLTGLMIHDLSRRLPPSEWARRD